MGCHCLTQSTVILSCQTPNDIARAISLDLVLRLYLPLWTMSCRWHVSMVLRAGLACTTFSWIPRAAFQSFLPVRPGSLRVRTQSSAIPPLSGKLWIPGTRNSNCVVRNSGLLACRAYNECNECDVPADLGPFLAVAAGAWHTCAVRTDGQLVCFGDSGFRQCDVPADLGPVVSVAAGTRHTCAVRTDGQLACFGHYFNQCDLPANLGPVLAIAVGQSHTCAVQTDGQLVCFGRNEWTQCDVPNR